jgi:hypothetical protein
MAEQKFKFWCPVEISKGKDKDGKEIMRLGGIASTMDKDADGEFLDPSGFDISDFKKSGVVNWHHQAKNSPATIIGEPHKAEIRKDGFYVETNLYPNSDLAKEVYQLAEVLQKDSKTRRLGYSIEGTVIERDINNPKIVKQAKITGLAITHMPKNPQTFADIIKGQGVCWDGYEKVPGKKDYEDDSCVKKDCDYDMKKDEEQDVDTKKTLDTGSGRAIMPASVDGYKVKNMTEEQRYDKIFDTFPGISIEKAEQFNNLLIKIEQAMLKGKTIETKDLQKAMSALGLDNMDENPFLEKAKKPMSKPSVKADDEDDDESDEEVAAQVMKEQYGYDAKKKKKDEADDEVKKGKGLKKEIHIDVNSHDEAEMEGQEGAEDEDEDEEEKGMKYVKKSFQTDIIKAINESTSSNTQNVRALAKLVKAQMDATELLKGKMWRQERELRATREDLQKALELVEELSAQPTGRKSITKGYVDRSFGADNLEKAGRGNGSATLHVTEHRAAILNVLDAATIAKGGYDEEFAKALMSFEAGSQLSNNVISRLKSEHNVNIVQ